MAALYVSNDNVVLVSGVVDTLDPVNTDGSPKLESTATVTWQIRTAAGGGGSLIASGTASWNATFGAFVVQLSHTIGYMTGNYLRVTITDANGNVAVLEDTFDALSRTGRTPTT